MAFHLARPAWQYLATAATALIRPASAASDQVGLAPKPRKCAITPAGPLLRVSHEISGGTASMATARPAVRTAAELTPLARLVPRSRSSGFSHAHHGAEARRIPYGWSVSHQNTNSNSVIPAMITDGSHHPGAVTVARLAYFPDGTATPCQRSSHPHACASAYTGASASTKVTIAPSSRDRTPTRTTAASGAMYLVSRRRLRSSGVPEA